MTNQMQLVHLTFTGPRVEPASVSFGPGLNVIYGPSNTGKSSILDAIDFMLGRDRALKEIPEHDSYEIIFLGIRISDGEELTLARSLKGADLRVFPGIHYSLPTDIEPRLLRLKRPTKKIESLPNFLLGKLELAHKFLRRNARDETESLTLRNFAPLFLINETSIQKETSPYISTQFTKQTVERSLLRFLLTGVDDSALIPAEKEKQTLSRQARLNLLSELIEDQESAIFDVSNGSVERNEIEEQQSRLTATLEAESSSLQSTEAEYRTQVAARNQLRQEIDSAETRLSEIQEMTARFELLNEQYSSDISRLENIVESGSLFVAFPSGVCPLCGAPGEAEHVDPSCDGDAEAVVAAANTEIGKIETLRADLSDVLIKLRIEASELSSAVPQTRIELGLYERRIEVISPQVTEQRLRYSEVINQKSFVDRTLGLFEDLDRLESKRREIEEEAPDTDFEKEPSSSLPTKSLHDLSQAVSSLLLDWGLRAAEHVHYDKETDDFVIGGKPRTSNGKGHRALTHAAATLALLKYTEQKRLPFPGFVILDSPLLAYEEPELDQDHIADSDINLRFFKSLESWDTRQTIIIENKKSIPSEYSRGEQVIQFTKSDSSGRYGFFPR